MANRHRVSSALVGALMLLVSPAARADEPGKPCQADVKKLCPGVKPGHAAILSCLEEKQDQVSQACKDELQAKMQSIIDACQGDVDKLCADVPPGEGKILKCLRTNESKVSTACKNVFAQAKAKVDAAQKAK